MTKAQIIHEFRKLEAIGFARISAEPETEDYFSVYGEPDSPEERREILETINRTGLWSVTTYTRCPHCKQWQIADSIGMCTGYDNPCSPNENSYVLDLMLAAILQHREAGHALALCQDVLQLVRRQWRSEPAARCRPTHRHPPL